MLRYHYDINGTEHFNTLFGNTWTGKNPAGKQNKYMVLCLNFPVVTVGGSIENLEQIFKFINTAIRKGLASTVYKDFLKACAFAASASTSDMLSKVCNQILHNPKAPRLYIIIDEYNNLTNQLITAGRY